MNVENLFHVICIAGKKQFPSLDIATEWMGKGFGFLVSFAPALYIETRLYAYYYVEQQEVDVYKGTTYAQATHIT